MTDGINKSGRDHVITNRNGKITGALPFPRIVTKKRQSTIIQSTDFREDTTPQKIQSIDSTIVGNTIIFPLKTHSNYDRAKIDTYVHGMDTIIPACIELVGLLNAPSNYKKFSLIRNILRLDKMNNTPQEEKEINNIISLDAPLISESIFIALEIMEIVGSLVIKIKHL